MQQLRKRRLTHTPADIPHVCGNCGPALNSPEGRDSVPDLKTFRNSPDAALTPSGKTPAGEDILVYVLNHQGKPLMPCRPRTARLLLKDGRAKVVKRTPFTIRWTVPTRSYTRRTTGYFDLRQLDGTKVCSSAPARKCRLLESARTSLVERRSAVSSPV